MSDRRTDLRTRESPTPSWVLIELVGVATSARTIWERWRMPPEGASSTSMPIAHHEQADAVAVMHRGRRQQGRRLRRAVGLGSPLEPEPHARRDVDHQPERQRPLLDEPADERPPCRAVDVPVDVADIVTRLIGAQFGEGQADARTGPVIGPRQLRHGIGLHAEA